MKICYYCTVIKFVRWPCEEFKSNEACTILSDNISKMTKNPLGWIKKILKQISKWALVFNEHPFLPWEGFFQESFWRNNNFVFVKYIPLSLRCDLFFRYQPPQLAISNLYWKGWTILIILAACNPVTIGNSAFLLDKLQVLNRSANSIVLGTCLLLSASCLLVLPKPL